MDSNVVCFQFDREVTVHRRIVEKVRFNDFCLVTEAENELSESMMSIAPHDMPENGVVSHRHHGLRPNLRFLTETRPKTTTQNEHRNVGGLHVWTSLRSQKT